jgi:hypothetical protein
MQFFFPYILYFNPLGTKHFQTSSIYDSLQWESKFYANIEATDVITVWCCSLYFSREKVGG